MDQGRIPVVFTVYVLSISHVMYVCLSLPYGACRWVRPQVVSGPRPGQRLQEGHYVMVLVVMTAEHPPSTCTLNYDVTGTVQTISDTNAVPPSLPITSHILLTL